MANGIINLAPGQNEVASYDATQAQAERPTAVGYDPARFSVQPQATVKQQFQDLSSMDSPLLKQARARATRDVNQKMTQRGLLNSSLAMGAVTEAADQAVYDKILPIAQQDATAYGAADTNTTNALNAERYATTQAQNAASLRGAELGTNVNLANADARNKAWAQAAEMANKFKQTGLETERAYGLSDRDTARAYGLSDKDTERAYGLSDKETARAYGLSDKETERALQLADKEYERAMGTAQLDATTRLQLAQMDHDTRMELANVDRDTRVELTTLENNYRQLLQTNQDLSTMFNQVSTNIANIASSNLSEDAKIDATQTQLNILRETLKAKQGVVGTPSVPGSTTPVISKMNIEQYYNSPELSPSPSSSPSGGNTQYTYASRPPGVTPDSPVYVKAGSPPPWPGARKKTGLRPSDGTGVYDYYY